MDFIRRAFLLGYGAVVALFYACALGLIAFAATELWGGLRPGGVEMRTRFNAVLEAIGLLTIAVAALELGQTILEEEIQRKEHMSAPTRVRRFLSRFMVVVIVSLAIESLVATFEFIHDDPGRLPAAAGIAVAAAALLAGWGVFVRMNRSAEELEPEGMRQAKEEDKKMR